MVARYHLLHTDLVFYAFLIRRSINYAKNICGGFAKRVTVTVFDLETGMLLW